MQTVRVYTPWVKALGVCLLILWLALAIKRLHRADWWLENALVFIAVPLLIRYGPALRFSNSTYTCLFVPTSLSVKSPLIPELICSALAR
jgi:uncharacterized membrane protein YjdF